MAKRARARDAPQFLDDDEVAAWHGLLQTSGRVLRELDQRLQREHRISVGEFDVLITLFNAPDERLRMAELARSVSLSPAGLTHLVARLERERLVRRATDPEDRRGSYTVLTAKGLARLNAARPVHNEVIRHLFLNRITTNDRRRLAAIWMRAQTASRRHGHPGASSFSSRGTGDGAPREP
ncbi:MAG TPA: MarR family transcriptional regulator [Gemmatimonadales bacterium]|nr:MarR family transcriptional regulator [Gemmatimonadales bacterium]